MQDPEYQGDKKELWKRVAPALVGGLALLAIPRAAMTALLTPMLFDAPGSTSKLSPYIMLIILLARPVMLLSTVILSFIVFRRFSHGRFAALLVLPALWWTSYRAFIAAAA
ncbi:hypothetical protein K7957_18265 [Sphingomonas yunnanensis]|uniref:hypothetical protein n=1 Tax=Sphingomonas yunnanensis TaxID=310400 RepID=UPI001CA79D96|nr:hypothetical protein [Sphingomonas yunnanensis]MBY9064884.1 hypothetical protein [Sphingomonas yunnanensis]